METKKKCDSVSQDDNKGGSASYVECVLHSRGMATAGNQSKSKQQEPATPGHVLELARCRQSHSTWLVLEELTTSNELESNAGTSRCL
jgi:hypothetical protein